MIENFLTTYSDFKFIIVPVVNIVDSIPFFSFLIPEEFTMALGGALLNTNQEVALLIALSSVSIMLSQVVFYILGLKYGIKMLHFFHINQERQSKLYNFLYENQLTLDITMRLSSTFRSLIAITSGIYKYPVKRFLLIEIIAETLRSSLFILIGYYWGRRFELLDSTITGISLFFFVIIAISLLISFFATKRLQD